MTDNNTQQLLDGLARIGDELDLQVFTAPRGITLLDRRSAAHRSLSVSTGENAAEVRLGASVHAVIPLTDEGGVPWLLELLRRVLVDGSWYETYAVDPARGVVEVLSWRLGIGSTHSFSSPSTARPASSGTRIHHQGRPWGPRSKHASEPPA
ncbi:MAG: hypothetical protein ACJ72D_16870 [Marmoricola sp.]